MINPTLKIGSNIYNRIGSSDYKVNFSKLGNFKPGDLPIHSSLYLTGIKQIDKIKLIISVTNGNDIDTKEYFSIHFFFETKSLNRAKGMEKMEKIRRLMSDLVINGDLPLPTSMDFSKFEHGKNMYTVGYLDSGEQIENILLKKLVDKVLIKFSMASRKIKAFICHASEDKPTVERFAKKLKSTGSQVWFDKWEIKIGDSIIEKIDKGLEDMTHLIIFISNISVTKPWVKKELSIGLMRKLSDNSVKVIPILLNKVDLPTILKDIKYADCIQDRNIGFKQAIESIVEEYDQIKF